MSLQGLAPWLIVRAEASSGAGRELKGLAVSASKSMADCIKTGCRHDAGRQCISPARIDNGSIGQHRPRCNPGLALDFQQVEHCDAGAFTSCARRCRASQVWLQLTRTLATPDRLAHLHKP